MHWWVTRKFILIPTCITGTKITFVVTHLSRRVADKILIVMEGKKSGWENFDSAPSRQEECLGKF